MTGPGFGNHKHGWTGTRLHNIWRDMLKRGNDLSNAKYAGRGIGVCKAWETFEIFRDWALANGYENSLTLNRKDNDGWYSELNCDWISKRAQARNRRTTRWIIICGVKKSLAEWCEINQVRYAWAYYQIVNKGCNPAEIFMKGIK